MKVRVINKGLTNFDEEYKVTNLNFDMIIAEGNNEKLYFQQDDVKIIPENEYENVILRCKDIIKIKLNRGISLRFYTIVLDVLKQTIGEEVNSINLLRDEYKLIKKGLWEKIMLVVVNEKFSYFVSVIGRNYGDHFDVTVKDYTLERFVNECCLEIEYLKQEIAEKEQLIKRYKKGMKDVIDNYCNCRQRGLLIDSGLSEVKNNTG